MIVLVCLLFAVEASLLVVEAASLRVVVAVEHDLLVEGSFESF